jgi:DNA adenine methylase
LQDILIEDVLSRALSPNSARPRAFLRWAGSKRFLLKHLIDILPSEFETYREPFLGSGALYFLLQPQKAVLSDVCIDLVNAFLAVRDNVNAVLEHLAPLKPHKEIYYNVRQNRSISHFKYAAEFIYLNKTCWNGLYRVNAAGAFNVPFGRVGTDSVIDGDNLKACASTLGSSDTLLKACDFEESLKDAKAGDLVYLDPPYVTGHNNNGFIAYNEVLFSWEDQIRLATLAQNLADMGVHVIVSNANHDEVIKLYPRFKTKYFSRSSTLASDVKRRRIISEVLLFT